MSTIKEKRLTWFKFFPSDLIHLLTLSNEEAGIYIKTFLTRLISNSAPDGSLEARMISEVIAYTQQQRENIMKRWNNRNNGEADDREAPDGFIHDGKNAASSGRTTFSKFANKEAFIQWAIDDGLDPVDADECWTATAERNGRDADGNIVKNMKAFARKWCSTRKTNRRNA